MGFNKEQTQAIEASSKVDILISAGAGSGKTKTLSQRVSNLLREGLKPSELLILTFTDNAAHEMKERIISDLKKLADEGKISNQMVVQVYSAHIQTFDSFSSYLVRKYASRLGISDRITVASESVISTKENRLLDDIFDEYYKDEEKSKRLFETLKKFNLQGDQETKSVVLDLYHQLGKLILPKKNEILNNYDEKYLSREFFDNLISNYIKAKKEEMREFIWKTYIESNLKEKLADPVENEGYLKTYFSQKGNFDSTLTPGMDFYYHDKKGVKTLDVDVRNFFPDVISLLHLEGEEFISKAQSFIKDHESDFPPKGSRAPGIAKVFRNNLFDAERDNCILKDLLRSLPLDEEYQKCLSFKDDIHLMLDIIKELERRLFEYKKMCGYFTFQDISNLALSLLIDPKYQDIAEEIRSRFKYIMVDEYQDANDFQEIFVNELLKEDNESHKAHVFCVGDAKQSIYAFRNSNVALFRGRQDRYNDGNVSEHYVIPMNKNYRSGPGLLKDINYIFDSYMTLTHGSINYCDASEQLEYDSNVNIYSEEYNHFGVYRLLSMNEDKDDWNASCGNMRSYCREWEARAIAKDIKNKIENKFKVYDRGSKEHVRPCKYSDFAILMRKKSGFELYQKIFNEEGIPLNVTTSTDLKEVNCVILIQSLMKMIGFMLGEFKDNPDPKHYFVSIARSYIYQYDDETIYNLLAVPPHYEGEPYDDLKYIREDKIFKDLQEFTFRNKGESFDNIFIDMLNTFHIIDKLYLLGNVQDNISKIESIRELVVSSEKAGEGLKEFINLLLNINKYSLSFAADSVIQTGDAVDMMTIHASKGLERKIVYLPYSYNSISKGGGGKKPDYFFDERFGVQLPNYLLGDNEEKKERIHFLPYDIALNTPSENGDESDEHVRLFYVALTRAENMIYIVGDDYQSEAKDLAQETLYGMLDYSTHYPVFNEERISSSISPDQMQRYNNLVNQIKSVDYYLSKEDLKGDYDHYKYLFDEIYRKAIKESLDESVNSINESLYDHYHLAFFASEEDDDTRLDKAAKLFDALNTHIGVASFKELADFFAKNKQTQEIEEEEVEGVSFEDDDENEDENFGDRSIADNYYSEEDLKEIVIKFYDAAKKRDPSYFGFNSGSKDDKQKKLTDKLLPAFARLQEDFGPLTRTSYKTDDYEDKIERISLAYWGGKKDEDKIPEIKKYPSEDIDDSEIVFEKKVHRRASKTLEDDELDIKERLDYGTHLHRLLELYDFKKMDLGYIKDERDMNIIKRVITSDIFKEAYEADEVYQEYEYYDEEYASNGSIDLLYRKDNHFTVVDYKTSNIDDPAYIEQLHTYQRNIESLFGVKPTDISLYLLSISKGTFKKVDIAE